MRAIKDSASKEYTGDEETKNSSSPWKPQLHFVWDAVLDFIVPPDISATNTRTFENFYRIVVDGAFPGLKCSLITLAYK